MKSISTSILLLVPGLVDMASADNHHHSFLRHRTLKKEMGQGSGASPTCPNNRNKPTCDLPEDMQCEFGELDCNGVVGPAEECECLGGEWTCLVPSCPAIIVEEEEDSSYDTCPTDEPTNGTSCNKAPFYFQCDYGTIACPDGSTLADTSFFCDEGTGLWTMIQASPCPPEDPVELETP
jgi:hypothetical protein